MFIVYGMNKGYDPDGVEWQYPMVYYKHMTSSRSVAAVPSYILHYGIFNNKDVDRLPVELTSTDEPKNQGERRWNKRQGTRNQKPETRSH